MGGKQSKRSVDITNSPSKTAEGEAVGEGEGRVVKIGDADIKTATNGTVPHTDIEVGEKDENEKDSTVEKIVEKENADTDNVEINESKEVKENGVSESEELKTPDSDSAADNLNEVSEKSPESATEGKEEATSESKKQKEKKKKKWSFRSISFSKKDKSKPGKDAEKNGDVKEVAEENVEDATSPTVESPKAEKAESSEEPAPVVNGDASKEEIETPKTDAPPEEPKKEEPTVEETKPEETKETADVEEPKVEPKVPEPVVESAPSPVKDQEEPNLVKPTADEKEVRNEEVPPPLPSSNPPSSVTVFAESTKADILTTQQIDLLQAVVETSQPVIEKDLPKEVANVLDPLPVETKIIKSVTSELQTSQPLSPEKTLSEPIELNKSTDEKSTTEVEVPIPTKSEPLPEPEKSDSNIESKSDDIPASIPEQHSIIENKSENIPVSIPEQDSIIESKSDDIPASIPERDTEGPNPEPVASENSIADLSKVEQQVITEPVVHDIMSAISSEPSETSDPLESEEPKTIELKLEPLPREEPVEAEKTTESKDLQSKTELEVSQSQEEEVPEPVEVKKTPENIDLVGSENTDTEQNKSEADINKESSTSLPTGFIQTPTESVESNVTSVDTNGLTPVELIIEDAKPQQPIEQPHSEQSINYSEESESIDLPPPQESEAPKSLDCPNDLPSPTDLPPPSSALVDPADSLQDISTESLPSLPEPVSDNLVEPLSLPPVDSVPEPIATDCMPVESLPLPSTEYPVLTNGSTNGLPSSPGEVSPTTNGGSILSGEAAVKQVPQEVPCDINEGEKNAAVTSEVAVLEE